MNIQTTREFRKHTVLGDIYAVEWINGEGPREVGAAHRCTKPEELTLGALPVLPLGLEFGDENDEAFVRDNADEFARWEPPMADLEKLAAIIAAEETCQYAESQAQAAQKTSAAAKKVYEKACDDLRRAVRLATLPPAEPAPLLALAELPEEDAKPFDADMENFDERPRNGSEHAGTDGHPV